MPQPGTTCPSLVCCSTPQGRPSWGAGLEVWWLGGNPHPTLHSPTFLGTANEWAQNGPSFLPAALPAVCHVGSRPQPSRPCCCCCCYGISRDQPAERVCPEQPGLPELGWAG
ncbi:unnamed protein product [Rangifer tarandus platyrhynchus]|uniref:Uncharacterized protein n=1 Tax=Rangifer tarandus platyrhynchus TaxID=3082113 RepID=A0AC59Z596_RANTA